MVVDLSALWAGPLCTQLLQMMGARVIKVESSGRPDAMRTAATGFFDLLNAGKASVVLDFSQPSGREALHQLLRRADIIIEASRPRALRQLGVRAEDIVRENPAATWLSICGYGRDEPAAQWVAFGDDAAVAGGLSQVLWDCSRRPMFCADAIADPLAGMHAALAAWWSFTHGGGRLLSLHCATSLPSAFSSQAPPMAEENRATARELECQHHERGRGATARAGALRAGARPRRGHATPSSRRSSARGGGAKLQRALSAARLPASRPKKVASASDSPEL